MTIANRDAELAAWLDSYSPALDPEREAALFAAVEARLGATPRPWSFLPPRQLALFTGAAACAVLVGFWVGGGAVQSVSAPFAVAGLLLGQGG